MKHYQLLIGGELVDAAGGARVESVDPGTGRAVATWARAGRAEAEQAIEAARRAFEAGTWSGASPAEPARVVMDLTDRIAERTREMSLLVRVGHPVALAGLGVTEADLGPRAELAAADLVTLANPRAVRSSVEVIATYRKAL